MSSDGLKILQSEIEDMTNVDDREDDEDESTSADLFSISSYGVDHTVESLTKRLGNNSYYIPDFQRKYVWSQNDASKFIESLLLGLPVPGIFLYKENETARHLVIDGQQRLRSLQMYTEGIFREKKFRLTGLKSRWNGLAFLELSDDDRLRFEDAIIHATVFKQDTPTDSMDSVYEVFERINTGGMKLSPQEIRSCVAHGEFNRLLFELNDNPVWRQMYGFKSIRLKDVELILRFLAFLDNVKNYRRPIKKFLTDFMSINRELDPATSARFSNSWAKTIEVIRNELGPRPFRLGTALNAAFFDCFVVETARAVMSAGEFSGGGLKLAYDRLAKDEEFLKVISSATSNEENVQQRFAMAATAIAECYVS